MVAVQQVPQRAGRQVGGSVLTISKLKRWSINYYIDTARSRRRATTDLRRANGGLGEYYSEHETRTPVWLCAGDARRAAALVGLRMCSGPAGKPTPQVVARWLDDGIAPNGGYGRGFGARGVHGFDLTFCAPKSVSLLRALTAPEVAQKAVAERARDRDRRGNGIPRAACRLHPGAQPGHGAQGSGAVAGVGGDRLPARDQPLWGSASAHPCDRARTARPAPTGSWCLSTAPRCFTKPKRPG